MTDMRKSRFTEQQIIGFLKPTFYKWRAKYGGMEADEARRLKDLEVENARLKKLLAEAHLDLEALKVGFGVKR
jgi:putative transposase